MAGQATTPRGGTGQAPPKKKSGIDLGPPGSYTPPSKGAPSERATFIKFMNAHPALKSYAADIWQAARTYGGFTPTEYAAVLWAESKGDPNALSGAGALGIAQIYDKAANAVNEGGVPFFRPGNLLISDEDKKNPKFAINYLAWRLSGYKAAHGGNIDDAWMGGYNPKYSKTKGYNPKYISQYLPKGYVPTGGPTIGDTATKSVDTSAVTKGMTDPWVVGVSKAGKLIVSSNPVAPKNALLYDGAPITASGFKSVQRSLDNYFASYTGGRANPATVLKYIQKGWGTYALTVALSKSKGFQSSPIYKKYAPAYQDAVKDLLAPGTNLSKDLIRAGIVNGWDSTTLAAVVRRAPGYVQSNEFKQKTATLSNVHQSIMGVPDQLAQYQIQQAAAAGWSPDQYAAHLRTLPEYTMSPEYQTKALTFLSSLGLITGATPVLKKSTEVPANPNLPDNTTIPYDPRIQHGSQSAPEDTVATLNG